MTRIPRLNISSLYLSAAKNRQERNVASHWHECKHSVANRVFTTLATWHAGAAARRALQAHGIVIHHDAHCMPHNDIRLDWQGGPTISRVSITGVILVASCLGSIFITLDTDQYQLGFVDFIHHIHLAKAGHIAFPSDEAAVQPPHVALAAREVVR